MPNLNKVMLMGNITRDIELRTINSGTQVAQIGLAINRRWTGQDGERREETTFVDCEAWGKQAEVMHKYLAKGRPVYIEGRLKLDTWDDKETGQKRSKMRVVVEAFEFIDSGNRQGGGGGGGGDGGDEGSSRPQRSAAPARSAPARPAASQEMNPDDIPF
ncbi:MAG: single-stranded DNA-binding protein [Phycisphaerales bacterium]